MRIQVIPSELRMLAALWRQVALTLEDALTQSRRAWSGLDWEMRQQVALEELLIQAQRQGADLQEQAERLARFLEERAEAFEQADSEGATRLLQTVTAWRAATAALGTFRSPAPTFPLPRAAAYLRLGALMTTSLSPPLAPLRIKPHEQRALLESFKDIVLEKAGLGLLRDVLDTLQVPAWQREVDAAFAAWSQAQQRYGQAAPQTQAAYAVYFEALLFRMPFLGNKIESFISMLNILGRMKPME